MWVAAVAVFSCGGACVIELIGVSVCCRGGSCAWVIGGNSFGIELVAVSLGDGTGEGLSAMDVDVTGASAFWASEAMRSADGAG